MKIFFEKWRKKKGECSILNKLICYLFIGLKNNLCKGEIEIDIKIMFYVLVIVRFFWCGYLLVKKVCMYYRNVCIIYVGRSYYIISKFWFF